mgnify:CR=1 FL=1
MQKYTLYIGGAAAVLFFLVLFVFGRNIFLQKNETKEPASVSEDLSHGALNREETLRLYTESISKALKIVDEKDDAKLEEIRDILFGVRVPSVKKDAHFAAALWVDTHSVSDPLYWEELRRLLLLCL